MEFSVTNGASMSHSQRFLWTALCCYPHWHLFLCFPANIGRRVSFQFVATLVKPFHEQPNLYCLGKQSLWQPNLLLFLNNETVATRIQGISHCQEMPVLEYSLHFSLTLQFYLYTCPFFSVPETIKMVYISTENRTK